MFEVEVVVNGEVYGTGGGASKQAAAKEAARLAIERLDLEPDDTLEQTWTAALEEDDPVVEPTAEAKLA